MKLLTVNVSYPRFLIFFASTFILTFLLTTSQITFAHTEASFQNSDQTKKAIYRFSFGSDKKVLKIANSVGFDVAGVDVHAGTADLVLSEDELQVLKDKYELTPISNQPIQESSLFPDTQYKNSDEVHEILQSIKAKYPNLVELYVIGLSTEGRNIEAIKISDNPSQKESGEPAILFNAMHHARELMTTEVAIDTIEYLLFNYVVDQRVTNWVDQNEIWIVPMLNPDGNNRVWTENSMWRKNTRGGYGVDLNRNYPFNWNKCSGSSGSTSSDTYRGPSAASEPETKALMNLVSEIRPVFNLSYHSYSEMVLYPYGCRSQTAKNRSVLSKIANELASRIPSDYGSRNYVAGTPWELLYQADGGDIDWMHGKFGVIPYVIELNHSNLGFQPSYAKWRDKTVVKLRKAWSYLFDRMHASGIQGVAKNVNGDPVQDALVTITLLSGESEEGSEEALVFELPVKSDGSFHVILDPGMYGLQVHRKDRSPQQVKALTVGENKLEVEVIL